MKRGISVNEHMNSYTKLLTDLVNMDVEIDEEDKAVILLNSLLEEEYETFTLTLINGRQSLNYNEVSAALVNYKVRMQDIFSFFGSTTTEALAVRGRSSLNRRVEVIRIKVQIRIQRSEEESVCLMQGDMALED